MNDVGKLEAEIELIEASLLPAESMEQSTLDAWPVIIDVTSKDSKLAVHISLESGYPTRQAVHVEIKGDMMGRDEAEGWKTWVNEKLEDWDDVEDFPLYQILTNHFLPLLAPSSPSPPPAIQTSTPKNTTSQPHHALLTSHHLLSPTKRKNLLALSSSLSLVGFSKTGHPGVMYAIGDHDDLVEWIREVKSWQWLALRVRISAEILEDGLSEARKVRGQEEGARGGKGRGEWVELEKVGEALEWLRGKGRENILTDVGIGA